MNPSNLFGSPQGGAFQAPSNNLKTGLFQSFGQQSNRAQTMDFYQPAFGQSSPHGNTVFGQSSAQPSTLPAVSQAPAFGQPSLGMGSSTVPAFRQSSGSNQSSAFGPIPAFGQPSAFGQAPGFGKQPPGFGQQPSEFGNSQKASGSTLALGQPQPLGFLFGQPSSSSVTTSAFGTTQSVTHSRDFVSSSFSFKPASEALFKPIFSASPEPVKPQTTSVSSSPFGSIESQTHSSITTTTTSTTTGFSLLTGAKSGPLGFSFSQPAAASSISAQNNPLTTGNSSGLSNTPQFTFSQPAAPSSSSTQASTSQPSTPSSFNFLVKSSQQPAAPLFGGTSFGQPSVFGDSKAKADTSVDEKVSNLENTNIFARLSKGTKRKEEPAINSTVPEKLATEENVPAEADSPRHPSKRPLMRSRGPPVGLFGRALSDLRRDGPPRREATQETQQQVTTWEEPEREEVQAQSDSLPATPATVPTQIRGVLDKAGESGEMHTSCSAFCIKVCVWIFKTY